uniref:Uncharacterized protein n=1 Tax=Lactuca sativa TaxID=4236 RepID=A0A9R1WCF1_LACSA|nr:hypothetical protein LSAT_V11C200097140 [Lactuca sativa]
MLFFILFYEQILSFVDVIHQETPTDHFHFNFCYSAGWKEYRGGKIEAEVKLTGILSLGALQPREVRKYGTTIARGLFALVVEVDVKVEEPGKDDVYKAGYPEPEPVQAVLGAVPIF